MRATRPARISTCAPVMRALALTVVVSLPAGGAFAADCESGVAESGTALVWRHDQARVGLAGGDAEARSFRLETSSQPRDWQDHELIIRESPSRPALRSGNLMLDATFALALQEAREASVAQIADGAFPAAACDCFETGKQWTYVWTRDISYATDLGLAWLDPTRAKNSLLFKLSERRGGGGPEIVQDTGSGGSWPVSTDRVVWARGAEALLATLDGSERRQFFDRAYVALTNTLESDLRVAFDEDIGLYRGETSFLDWREQTYAAYTQSDALSIAESFALSTNVLHFDALRIAARWAGERGDTGAQARYQGLADALAARIDASFWDEDMGAYASFLHGGLDDGPAARRDLLGEALAVTSGVASTEHADTAVATYPHTCAGPPVVWPQQPDISVYHNRASWPFVTAYGLQAARATGNAAVLEHDVVALLRAAALNLSNMENFEHLTLDSRDPVINSRRQIWSVAGYLNMVVDVLLGRQANADGLRFTPFLTPGLRRSLFPASDRLQLVRFPYRGKLIDLEVVLPPGSASGGGGGAYSVVAARLNGVARDATAPIRAEELQARNALQLILGDAAANGGSLLVAPDRVAPREPVLTAVSRQADGIAIEWQRPTGDGTISILRNGQRIAEGRRGERWLDRTPPPGRTSCYAAVVVDPATRVASQRSRPICQWDAETVVQIPVDDARVQATPSPHCDGGVCALRNWGAPGDRLRVNGFVPRWTGDYRLQIGYRNAGPINTGVTAAVKELLITDHDSRAIVARAAIVMPHTGTSPAWRESTVTAPVALRAGRRYDLELRDLHNMSYFEHFAAYRGAGGHDGPRNTVDLRSVIVLSMHRPLARRASP